MFRTEKESSTKGNKIDIINSSNQASQLQVYDEFSGQTFCDNTIATLIRNCWAQEPSERPTFVDICTLLSKKI